jgi:methionyl-tRNA formyltransferase
MSGLRIVFAGTPEFACPALQLLLRRAPPVAVLTQPDRPAGRGRRLTASPVKQCALAASVPVHQPGSLKRAESLDLLGRLAPDLIITAAYGLLLPPAVLELPRLGCWNLHASLLPRWRGASPIQQAVRAGDAETGVTLMQMDAGLDTGPMLLARAIPIGPDETAGELHDRLALLAAEVLADALDRLERGDGLEAIPQDDTRATHAPLIDKQDGRIDWNRDAEDIARQVRAFNPWPVAYGEIMGQPIRIFRARAETNAHHDQRPGSPITGAGAPDRIRIACGRGILRLDELQAPGRKRVSAAEWLNAHPDWRG